MTVRFTQTQVTATTSSQEVLATDVNRGYLFIQNKGAATIYVAFGAAATSANSIHIPAGTEWEPKRVPSDSVNITASSGSQSVLVVSAPVM